MPRSGSSGITPRHPIIVLEQHAASMNCAAALSRSAPMVPQRLRARPMVGLSRPAPVHQHSHALLPRPACRRLAFGLQHHLGSWPTRWRSRARSGLARGDAPPPPEPSQPMPAPGTCPCQIDIDSAHLRYTRLAGRLPSTGCHDRQSFISRRKAVTHNTLIRQHHSTCFHDANVSKLHAPLPQSRAG